MLLLAIVFHLCESDVMSYDLVLCQTTTTTGIQACRRGFHRGFSGPGTWIN
jgi:hypothetical protein